MPIHSSWNSTIQGLNEQYCKGKNDGAPAPFACKKARQIFYQMKNKNGWDEKKPKPSSDSDEWKNAVDFKVLTTKARNKLPKSAFCDPENRRYPAQDAAHIRNGLARIQQNKGDPKHDSILRCLLSRAKKAGIKSTVKSGKGDNSDFALIKECCESFSEKMFQYKVDGLLNPQMLLDSLETLPYCEELTDDEYLITLYFLMDKANEFLKVMKNE